MSYPRNAGTPPRISIGPVVQISDGAVQTSGVSITVVPQGQSAAAGLGTTSYEDGIVLYAPTQAETNYDAFVVIAYKTGCIPASVNVVTSQSSTAGYGALDWSKLTGQGTTQSLSGTTIKTATDVETDTADIQSRIPTALVSGRMDASVGAYQSGLTPLQPTVAGRTLDVSSGGEAGIDWANIGSPTTTVAFTGTTISTSQIVASVAGAVGSVTGAVGSVTGAVGSVTGAVGSVTGNVGGSVASVVARVTANTDQLAGQTVTAAAGVTFPASVASPTNITAGTITTVSGNVSGNVVGSVGSVVAPVTAGTVSDKTGYSLTNLTVQSSTILATGTHTAQTGDSFARIGSTGSGLTSLAPASTALSTAVWTGTMAGYLDAAVSSRSSHSAADVWSVATRTLTAFSFSVTVGTNNDKTGYSLATAPLDASGTAAAVWGALLASYTAANTFGARVIRSANSNNTVQITGSQHVAADIHELQAGVITAGDFATGAIDASALADDAASKIATAVRTNLATELARIDVTIGSRATQASVDTLDDYVDTEVAAIKAKTDNLPASPAAVGDIPTTTEIADMVLSRSITNTEASAGEYTLTTVVLAMLESSITGSTWTIRKTGGTTHATKTVTLDAAADPITGVT